VNKRHLAILVVALGAVAGSATVAYAAAGGNGKSQRCAHSAQAQRLCGTETDAINLARPPTAKLCVEWQPATSGAGDTCVKWTS
jgi:hypothetical protein